MGLLDGRVALITGGAQGLGFAIATRYVAEGAQVVLADLDGDAAVEAATAFGAAGFGVRADVADPDDVAGMVATAAPSSAAVARYGRPAIPSGPALSETATSASV